MKKFALTQVTLAFLVVIVGGGCATVTSGRYQEVSITSEPSGATVEIIPMDRRSGKAQAGSSEISALTPAKVKLKRKSNYTVFILKEGYETNSFNIWSVPLANTATVGSWLCFGGAGVMTDSLTGATRQLEPSKFNVTLKPK